MKMVRTREEILDDLFKSLNNTTATNDEKKEYIEYLHILDVCVEILESRDELKEEQLEEYFPTYEAYKTLMEEEDE
jgi:hypothetical protein